MSILKEAREIVRASVHPDHRERLRVLADELGETIALFTLKPTREAMRKLVADWTLVAIAIKNMPPSPPPGDGAGRLHAPVNLTEKAA